MLRVDEGIKPHTQRSEIKRERKNLPHGKFHSPNTYSLQRSLVS
jgi:hypothetical protein